MRIEVTPEMQRMAEELADIKGESLTAAVTTALQERLARERAGDPGKIAARLRDIGQRYAQLPDADPRCADDILGYDEHGLPT